MTIVSRRLYLPFLSVSSAFYSSCAFSIQSQLSSRRHSSFPSTSTTTMSSSASADSSDAGQGKPKKKQPIVQYIILRRDLDWPAGAMAAQAAHASVAAIAQALKAQDAPASEYISPANLPHMTKYVYGVDDLEQLELVRDKWREQFPMAEGSTSVVDDADTSYGSYYWWVEQPEDIPSAFATWPVERTNKVSKVIKNMKLTFF